MAEKESGAREKAGGFLKNLLYTQAEAEAPVAQPARTQAAAAPSVPYTPTPVGSLRPAMVETIRKDVFQGFTAYTRLLAEADKLVRAKIEREDDRLRAAIAITGLTILDLRDALTRHRQGLQAARSTFAAQSKEQRELKIDLRVRRLQEIGRQVRELEGQLARFRAEEVDLAAHVRDHEALFATAEADFAAAVALIEDELTTRGARIEALVHEVTGT